MEGFYSYGQFISETRVEDFINNKTYNSNDSLDLKTNAYR